MDTVDELLKERGSKYGKFIDQSRIAQSIKDALRNTPNWNKLDSDMKEALDMLSNKLGRLLNGDIYHLDSWQDGIGYLRLVEARLSTGETK